MKLTGRTILITGGSAGIGLAFAAKFLELGNEVIVTGRRRSVLDEAKSRLPKLHTIQSDIDSYLFGDAIRELNDIIRVYPDSTEARTLLDVVERQRNLR